MAEGKMPSATKLDLDPEVGSVDIRFYFDICEHPSEEVLADLKEAIEDHLGLQYLISTYQLVNDGFANLVPEDSPLT